MDNLPLEILPNIAARLSRYRLCACVLVCRSWYAMFISQLYTTVDIHKPKSFIQFVKTARNTEKRYQLGRLVRKMILPNSTCITSDSYLPVLFPFIVEFDHGGMNSSDLSEVLGAWKCIENVGPVIVRDPKEFPLDLLRHRITKLTIIIGSFTEWVDIMAELPRVEELQIQSRSNRIMGEPSEAAISFCELETLHENFPHIRTLTLREILVYGELPRYITPCNKVDDLQLMFIEGHRWGQYFAQKYTNLENLQIAFDRVPEINAEPESIVLAKSCRHLKQFIQDSGPMTIFQQVFEALLQIGAPMTAIKLPQTATNLYKKIVEGFQKTHSRASLTIDIRNMCEDAVGPLAACKLLVELDLRLFNHYLCIDQILDCCKHLTELKIDAPHIGVSNERTATYHSHGLRTLKLRAKINQTVYSYMSQRCPRLSSLDIEFHKFDRPYIIHLPNQNIKLLSITSDIHRMMYNVTRIDETGKLQDWSKRYQRRANGFELGGHIQLTELTGDEDIANYALYFPEERVNE
ncbi:hypothetical protein DFQ28_008841 [Apophysomyces sp. BC1034]|nr:hypothetical protein DFQ30_007861 [Apophysomyces sp. BC1015]KAG0165914.1 hypothetical protein DFQ30_007864 [Apophysomyces sp. BC1015]KAG0172791.1 hypothetical protein DFQ29_008224 [Apophysomyces sp. BC1021]KAG0185737.1 hypothetical protein DFQ28_008841 [Apophysomyces sp. BC1034]